MKPSTLSSNAWRLIPGEDKRKKRLNEILSSGEFRRPIIVFVNIKRNCDAIARDIKHMGFSSCTLHGGKTQEQREAALASVRNGTTDVLVATDLAGRGIDVPDVSACRQLQHGDHHRELYASYRSYWSCWKEWYCHYFPG